MILQNKPKVFLSHSKKDKEFIHRLCKDLRLCQIEPWLDSQEIRHGQHWLDAIFESGIPTCDAILVYLTENSVESAMVKKEIDAGIIKKLNESHVAFLPYVSQEILRKQLRMDIQALQTPVWNKENYAEMLPRVIAEIWHSYLDSRVVSVVNEEKVRRLEAELELERLKKTGIESIFEARENAEFELIWEKFDFIQESSLVHLIKKFDGLSRTYSVRIEIQTIIPRLDLMSGALLEEPTRSFNRMLETLIFECSSIRSMLDMYSTQDKIEISANSGDVTDLMNKLRICGLIATRKEVVKNHKRDIISPTEKLDRFKFWLYCKEILPNEIKYEIMAKK